MKIGLLTVYFADYGSFYHSMSLYQYLKSMGHDVELVHESHRYETSKKLMLSNFGVEKFPNVINHLIRDRVTAYDTYCVLRPELQKVKLGPPCKSVKERYSRYDCVVVGSDELWSSTNNTIGYVKDYFGQGISCPHISYATSGITLELKKLSPQQKAEMRQGLRTFRALSTRDDITKKWVETLAAVPCPKVLDPTLLNPFFVEHTPQQNFILVYGEHFSSEQQKAICQFANNQHMPLLSVAWKHAWCDKHLTVSQASDVQKAFASAAFCMSSTFHGTVFSILAHRPFMSFTSELRGAKIHALLQDLNLMDRLYSEDRGIIRTPINYDAVDNYLLNQRKQSETYLQQAIKLCK